MIRGFHTFLYCFLLGILFFTVSLNANAGAFQLLEPNAATAGDFHSGGAVDFSNVASQFFNPAIPVAIGHQQISVGGIVLFAQQDFRGTVFVPLTRVTTPTPPNKVVAQSGNFIPNINYTIPFAHNRLAFGFGVTGPFGLETNYTPLPAGIAVAATTSRLIDVDFNHTLSWLITKHFAVGAGFDLVYATVDFDNLVVPPPILGAPANFRNEVNGFGEGYNVGALIMFSPRTRIGASYRSKVTVDLDGKSELSGITQTHANAKLPLPPMSIFSIFHQFSKRLSMMASAYYIQWNVFKTVRLNNSALQALLGPGFVLVIPENYKNAWTYSIGAHVLVTPKCLLKFGFAYDETPTQTGFRDIRLPDADRYYVSTGVHFNATKRLGLDFGYIHVFFKRVRVDNSGQSAGSGNVVPVELGTSQSTANVVAAQLTYNIS